MSIEIDLEKDEFTTVEQEYIKSRRVLRLQFEAEGRADLLDWSNASDVQDQFEGNDSFVDDDNEGSGDEGTATQPPEPVDPDLGKTSDDQKEEGNGDAGLEEFGANADPAPPVADDGSEKGEDDKVEEVPPYQEWSKKELKAEIVARNETRDEENKMSVSGNLSELAARLDEDDAAQAEDDAPSE